MSKDSQHTQILKLLRAYKQGVPNYLFPNRGILNYTARISELRKDGYNIKREQQQLPNGRFTNVFKYYLIEESDSRWTNKLNKLGVI